MSVFRIMKKLPHNICRPNSQITFDLPREGLITRLDFDVRARRGSYQVFHDFLSHVLIELLWDHPSLLILEGSEVGDHWGREQSRTNFRDQTVPNLVGLLRQGMSTLTISWYVNRNIKDPFDSKMGLGTWSLATCGIRLSFTATPENIGTIETTVYEVIPASRLKLHYRQSQHEDR